MIKNLIIVCGVVMVILAVSDSAHAIFSSGGPVSEDFSYLGTPTKWTTGTNNSTVHSFSPPAGPITSGGATFSIMGAGFSDASTWDTGHGANSTQLITSLGVSSYSAADYALDISVALDTWAAISGFSNLGQVADGGVNAGASQASGGHLGDIRVAAWEITTSNVLAHAYQPGTESIYGSGGTIGGDMHFDVARTWVDNASDSSGNGQYDFFTVALHELGHSLGLGHSNVSGSVMEAVYAGARRSLTEDDIEGIQAIYGTPEPASLCLLAFGGLLLRRRKTA